MHMLHLRLRRLRDQALFPTFTSDSKGVNLYANIISDEGRPNTCLIPSHNIRPIWTGWAIEPPDGYCTMICSRQELTSQSLLVVDTASRDYNNEVVVLLHNVGFTSQWIRHGDCIAQLIMLPMLKIESLVEDLIIRDIGDAPS